MPKLSDYEHPSLAVDIVALCVRDGQLNALLIRRDDADLVGGDWALPGAFVHQRKPLEDAVSRAADVKAGLDGAHLEQLASYGDPGRDPRGHVVSIAYLALAPAALLDATAVTRDDLTLARITTDWPGEQGGPARALDQNGAPLRLAFDHAAILGDAVKRLRGKIDYSPVGFAFLPPQFTLREVQEVHEAILGRTLAKPAFRRKLLDRHDLLATGAHETGSAFRPAELYQLTQKKEA